MNSQQLKYARERLNEIYQARKASIGSPYSGLSLEEKIEAYNNGEIVIDFDGRSAFTIVFSGDKEAKEIKRVALDKLADEYKSILDELILGDNEIALNLINNFKGK